MSKSGIIATLALAAVGATIQESDAASVYLVGALSDQANASTGTDTSEPGEYDRFAGTANDKLVVNGSSSNLSILLGPGSTTLSVNTQYGVPVGLGLFFSTSPGPTTFAGGTLPNLVVIDPTTAANDFYTPTAGGGVAPRRRRQS